MASQQFRAGQRVRVATHAGVRDGVIVNGRVSRAGNVYVALQYAHDTRHDWRCRQCFGAPRPVHTSDVSVVRSR